MQLYLQNERGITIHYSTELAPAKSAVAAQLKNGRPVVYADQWDDPQVSGATANHDIVTYGYDENNINGILAHFGWPGYSAVEATSDVMSLFVSSISYIAIY